MYNATYGGKIMFIPESIQAYIRGLPCTVDSVGQSGSKVLCFDDMVLKIEPVCFEAVNERRMMEWLHGRLPVPEPLACEEHDGISYLLMSRIKGRMLCSDDILRDSDRLIRLMTDALLLLWDAGTKDCPADMSLDTLLALAEKRVAAGLCSTDDAEPDTYGPKGFASPEQLLQWLQSNRPDELPVLSHGDFCLPNIFTDGEDITGFIDLGRCGRSDRYRDLALGLRSMHHNLSGTYTDIIYPAIAPERLFDRLGITPDKEMIRYYILLDELF